MNRQNQVSYKDFFIWADTYTLAESGEWRSRFNIMRRGGDIINTSIIKHTFKSEEEAVYHTILFGKLTIDGMLSDSLIEDT